MRAVDAVLDLVFALDLALDLAFALPGTVVVVPVDVEPVEVEGGT